MRHVQRVQRRAGERIPLPAGVTIFADGPGGRPVPCWFRAYWPGLWCVAGDVSYGVPVTVVVDGDKSVTTIRRRLEKLGHGVTVRQRKSSASER